MAPDSEAYGRLLKNPIERDTLSSVGIGVINVQAGTNLRGLFKLPAKRLEDMEGVLC